MSGGHQTNTHSSFPSLFPLFSISQLYGCLSLLSLKGDLMMSSSNNDIFSSEFPLPFHSPSDVPWVSLHMYSWSHFPSYPFGTLFHFFDTQSFLSWSKTFNIIVILEKKVPPVTTQLLFTMQIFKEGVLFSLPLTLTTSLHLTPSLWSSFGDKVLSWGMLWNTTEWGWDLDSENVGSVAGSTIYYLNLTFFITFFMNIKWANR